jgi:hypothetical protein
MLGMDSSIVSFLGEKNATWYISLDICASKQCETGICKMEAREIILRNLAQNTSVIFYSPLKDKLMNN